MVILVMLVVAGRDEAAPSRHFLTLINHTVVQALVLHRLVQDLLNVH